MNTKIIRNFFWLASTQGLQFVFPLITIPYLTRTLSPVGYGQLVLISAIGGLLSLLCDYGFAWTGVQEISANRDDQVAVSKIFMSIMIAKISLFVVSGSVYILIITLFYRSIVTYPVLLLAPLVCLGSILVPTWFLQALERMGQIALLSFVVRVIGVIGMLMFVKSYDDVGPAVLISAAPNFVLGIVTLCTCRRWISLARRPTLQQVGLQLRSGLRIFVSTAAISLYTQGLTVLVGSIGGVVHAASYGLADRCLTVGKAGISASYQAAMPQAAYLARHDPEAGIRFILKHIAFTFPMGLVGSLTMYFLAEKIVILISGKSYVAGAAPLFMIMSPIPITLSIASSLTSLYMLNYGLRKEWSFMIFGACGISFAVFTCVSVICPVEQAAAWGGVSAELSVAAVSSTFFIRALRRSAKDATYFHGSGS